MNDSQKTSWGSVEWLRTASETFGLSCGIVTLNPHAKQEEHIHYESEQVCYVLEGRGRVTVNGMTREFGPGTAILMPANCRNSFENTGERPVRHLLIASAVEPKAAAGRGRSRGPVSSAELAAAVELLKKKLQSSSLPLAIFDREEKLLFQGGDYPSVCEACMANLGIRQPPCFFGRKCDMGLTVFSVPLLAGGSKAGKIVSGHILLGGQREDVPDLYDAPVTAAIAIRRWTAALADNLLDLADMLQTSPEQYMPLLPLPDGRTRTGHPLADSVIQWLNSHFAEEGGTQELADANYTSPANLCRVFRRETGETISGYRNRIRIRHAMDLAADPDVPLHEVGALCGYPSENNFYRQFKRITGKTPGEYRRSAQTSEFVFPGKQP